MAADRAVVGSSDYHQLLLHGPSVIFLDEPTLGLDVLAKQQMIRFLKEINHDRKTTVVVTSHDMDDLEEMARRIVLLNKGQIAFDGNFNELREVMGACSRIVITLENESDVPVIPGLTLLTAKEGVCEYEFNRGVTGISEVLGHLAAFHEIEDVEIKKAPIEDVIAKLYLSWKE